MRQDDHNVKARLAWLEEQAEYHVDRITHLLVMVEQLQRALQTTTENLLSMDRLHIIEQQQAVDYKELFRRAIGLHTPTTCDE